MLCVDGQSAEDVTRNLEEFKPICVFSYNRFIILYTNCKSYSVDWKAFKKDI